MSDNMKKRSGEVGYFESVNDVAVAVSLIDAIRENNFAKIDKILQNSVTATRSQGSEARKLSTDSLRKEFFSHRFGNLVHLAAAYGSKQMCQMIIASGVNFKAVDGEGNTPLHKAAGAGRHDIIDYLLKEDDIDDTVRNVSGKTALDLCKTKESIAAFEYNRKSYISSKTKEMFAAAKNRDFETVRSILSISRNQQLMDINVLDTQSGEGLIHLAVVQGDVVALKWLLEHGANPFLKNKKGKLPMELSKDDKVKLALKEAPMTKSKDIVWASGSSFRMEGYLNKWTNYATGYKKRWFVLENGILSYYRSQADYPVSCRGSVHLKVAKIVADMNDRNRFEVEGKGSISYHVRADNKEDAKKWLVALTEAKKWMDEMEPPKNANNGDVLLKDSPSVSSFENVAEETSLQEGQLAAAHIRSTLLQLELSEQLLESLTGYVQSLKENDDLKKLVSEYSNGINTIMNAVKSTLIMCEEREVEVARRLVSECAHSKAMEDTVKQLAIENDEFNRSMNNLIIDNGASNSRGKDEMSNTDDEFYDAMSDSENTASKQLSPQGKDNCIISKSIIGYPEKPRTSLPPRAKDASQVSLWSVIKNAIGKDLTRITIPVNFNEPLSMLQRMCEDMEYSQLLDMANKREKSLDRIQFVAAFAVSNYSSTDGRTGKPFNPLLGETFEYVSRDKGFRYVSEQVSHHPAISACYCESDNYIFWSEVNVKTNFTPTTFEAQPLGTCHVILKATNEHFSWKKVHTTVHNIIVGKLWIDHKGVMTVTNHSNGETCSLTFKETGWRTKEPKLIEGAVKDGSGAEYATIKGKWNDKLVSTQVSGSSNVALWKKAPRPENSSKDYNFTSFAMQLNELNDGMKDFICPTDCRLRPDQQAMEQGEYDLASKMKNSLEEKQRAVRKEREKENQDYSPRWFHQDIEEDTNEKHWVFKGGYWESREKKQWESVPSIFLDDENDQHQQTPK